MELYKIRNLTFRYPLRNTPALDNIELSVERGGFYTLLGGSGCGKTTLLRHLKTVLTPHGERHGEILFNKQPLDASDIREQARKIGFVMQNPDSQIVTDRVWHELSFGLENLGFPAETIRLRTAETADYFGLSSKFFDDVATLSGGQKQLLNLAAVMALSPEVLILDEPTARLDPVAAGGFLSMLVRLNLDLGTTVIISEQRLDEVFSFSDRVIAMRDGRIVTNGTPREAARVLSSDPQLFYSLPAPARITARLGVNDPSITLSEGRDLIEGMLAGKHVLSPQNAKKRPDLPVLTLKEVWFRYEKHSPDVLRALSLTLNKGELLAVVGANGAGKSTLLGLAAGLLRPFRGEVKHGGKTALIPQDAQTLFARDTVYDELAEIPGATRDDIEEIARVFALSNLFDAHPYDLSGGETQAVAFAKLLLTKPDILLLDEPTKGMDAQLKRRLAETLGGLRRAGMTILMVSHDVEFCVSVADRAALLFDGGVIASGTPRALFAGNSFYTTSANRMARGVCPDALTDEDVVELCEKK